MKVIGRPKILEFMKQHADSKGALESWLAEVEAAQWASPLDVKERYAHASIINRERIVFNIKGNHYRIVTQVNFTAGVVLIEKIGTHAEYSRWIL